MVHWTWRPYIFVIHKHISLFRHTRSRFRHNDHVQLYQCPFFFFIRYSALPLTLLGVRESAVRHQERKRSSSEKSFAAARCNRSWVCQLRPSTVYYEHFNRQLHQYMFYAI